MKILLQDWAAKRYSPPLNPETPRRWAKAGLIVPAPVKIGRAYYVDPKAKHIEEAYADVTAPT